MAKGSPEFLDTNILVYEWDSRDLVKREIARKLVQTVGGNGAVSSQVLQEFASVMRGKLRATSNQIKALLASYRGLLCVPVDMGIIEAALDTADQHKLSFWDALVVETAVSAGCKTLYTEDLNAGQTIRGVQVVNPFAI